MSYARLGILLTIALALCAAGPAAAAPGQGLVKLPDEAGLVILGAAPYDQIGASLAGPGDVDGDGRADLFAGSQATQGGSEGLHYGAAFMLRGGPAGVLALSSTEIPPAFGHSIRGSASTSDVMPEGAFRVGDVNADARPDLAVRMGSGQIFVVYGRAGQRPTVRVDQPLPATDGFEMKTTSAIGPIASAGDFNGDGVGDLVVASPGEETFCTDFFNCDPYTGLQTSNASAKVIFGRAARSGPPLDLSTLSSADGVTVTLPPKPVSDVEAAGDVNGDGHGDVIVGMPEVDGGRAYVIYGSATPPSFQILGDELPQSRGYVLLTDKSDVRFGTAVAGVGDVNGDKLADVAVGAPNYDGGRAWIVHSRKLASKVTLSASTGPDRENFDGPPNSGFGSDVTGVGDVNGDGRPDLAVTGPDFNAGTGAAWVMHSPGANGVNFASDAGGMAPSRGFVIRPSEPNAGYEMRVAGLGNGQLAIAFPRGGGAVSGAVYVVSLKSSSRFRRTLPSLSVKLAKTSVIAGTALKLALKTTQTALVTMRLFRFGSRKSCAVRRSGETAAACTPELIAVGGSARALGTRTQGTRKASFPVRAAGKKLAAGKYLAVFRASDGKSRSLLRTAPFTVR